MKIIIDTHVHLYPCYQLGLALTTLIRNLDELAPRAIKAAFLAERSDCQFFMQLPENIDQNIPGEHELTLKKEKGVISIIQNGMTRLYLFPGRQIVTSERIEILSLTADDNINDGFPYEITIDRIIESGGVPVISWAPGKWFFKRGKVVKTILEQMHPDKILIGDTSLRPTLWKKPLLMRMAEKKGFKILAGSDPLPFSGEEVNFGTYGSLIDGAIDFSTPVGSIRSLLTQPEVQIRTTGRRNSLLTAARRLAKNAQTHERFD